MSSAINAAGEAMLITVLDVVGTLPLPLPDVCHDYYNSGCQDAGLEDEF